MAVLPTGLLVDMIADSMADVLVGWLARWIDGWLADWLNGWMADMMDRSMRGWMADWLDGVGSNKVSNPNIWVRTKFRTQIFDLEIYFDVNDWTSKLFEYI